MFDKNTLERYSKLAEELGYKLATEGHKEAVDANHPVKYNFYCPKHNKNELMRPTNFKRIKMLSCCRAENPKVKHKKYTLTEVKQISLEKGFEFLDDKYINNSFHHNFLCKKHNEIHLSRFDSIFLGFGLRCCGIENGKKSKMLDLEKVKKECLELGFELLDTVYLGDKKKHNFKCLKHNEIHKAMPNNIKRGGGLQCCYRIDGNKTRAESVRTPEMRAQIAKSVTDYFNEHPEARELQAKNAIKLFREGRMPQTLTKPHKIVTSFLDAQNVNHITEYSIGKYSIDEFLPDKNICIEVQGDYFHSNPKKYPDGTQNDMQKQIYEKDIRKKNFLETNGYKVVYLWEDEIKSNVFENKLLEVI